MMAFFLHLFSWRQQITEEDVNMAIPGLRGLGFIELFKKAIGDFIDDDMLTHSSALAFQALFSVFPFVLFLVSLLAFLDLSFFFTWLREELTVFLPQTSMRTVNQVLDELQRPREGLLSFGALVALWIASAAIRSIMHAMNIAFDAIEERPLWKSIPLSIFFTVGLAVLLILGTALLTVGPQAMQWLATRIGLEQVFVTLWAWSRLPVAFLLLNLAIALIYYVSPNIKQKFRFITPGALIAVTTWIVSSMAFNYYVANIADYNAMYGGIGAVIALLMYFFISSTILLFGAEINAVVQEYAGEIRRPHKRSSPSSMASDK
jgi:membrane protein